MSHAPSRDVSSTSDRTATPRPAVQEESGIWPGIAAGACVAFLAFVAGTAVMHFGVAPAKTFDDAYRAAAALVEKETAYNDPLTTDLWKPARTTERGVVRHDAAKAQAGLTLYTSAHDQRATLIDMDGTVRHEWAMPFSELWDDTAAVKAPVGDAYVYFERAHVFPNGDLLALYSAIGDTPWGYGLAMLDRDGNVKWKYLGHAHHAFDIDSDGNILVLTHEISERELPGFDHLGSPRIDDFIVKLSPDGEELGKTWLIGALAESPRGRLLHFIDKEVNGGSGDFTHANSVDILERPIPGVPGSAAGQVLVSMRELSLVALYDLDSERVVWSTTGPWLRQHDAEALDNGNILLFDNEGGSGRHGVTRVLEVDPKTLGIAWSYEGTEAEPFESIARGSQNRLANGNTLIVESYAGRIFEVTPAGETVWEYVNPVRAGAAEDRIPVTSWVERIDPDTAFTPEFRALVRRPPQSAAAADPTAAVAN